MPRGQSPYGKVEKGSLDEKAITDPALRRRLTVARRQADADLKSLNHWAASGCTSMGEVVGR